MKMRCLNDRLGLDRFARRLFSKLSPHAVMLGVTLASLGCDDDGMGPETPPERFLEHCGATCDGGFVCLHGACSVPCSDDAGCEGLAPDATCRALELGRTRRCDVACETDADCTGLGTGYSCRDYYCRVGAAQGQSCRVAYIDYESGTTDIAAPRGCGDCRCHDGLLSCTEAACPDGVPVVPCNGQIDSDPISKDRAVLVGNALTLDVSHPGGCARHDYAVCYADVAAARGDVVEVHVIHDAHGDRCLEQTTATLTFDLTPLGVAYQAEHQTAGAIIATGYGTYGFGELDCDQRRALAQAQVGEIAGKADGTCQAAQDCTQVTPETSCSAACPLSVSRLGQAQLSSQLAVIDEIVCTDAATCSAQPPACPSVSGADCVNGRCVAASN